MDKLENEALKIKMLYIEVYAKLGTNASSMFENIKKNRWKEINRDNDEEISKDQNNNLIFGLGRPIIYQAKKAQNKKVEKKSCWLDKINNLFNR